MINIEQRLQKLLQWANSTENQHSKSSDSAYVSLKIQVKHVKDVGRGIYATDKIERNERLVRIPSSYLLNFTTVVAHITAHNPNVVLTDSIFGNLHIPPPNFDAVGQFYAKLEYSTLTALSSFQIVSLFLVLELHRPSLFWKPFMDMLPEVDELGLSPLVWTIRKDPEADKLTSLLPRSARKHAEAIHDRFSKDMDFVESLLQGTNFFTVDRFLWAWMCINSRCLYLEMPLGKSTTDNFTMAPYIDFLNHLCEDQCGIKTDSSGFFVYTSTSYKQGDELYFSYGPHSNEFLLCEYGFVLQENKWNYIDISEYIIPLLRPSHVDFLKSKGYYNDYTVNKDGMSFRTEIALATLQELTPATSRRLNGLVDGLIHGAVYEERSNTLLTQILKKLASDSQRKLLNTELLDVSRKEAILKLHRDILEICEKRGVVMAEV